MSATLAAARTWMQHAGARRQRYGHPYFGVGYWVFISDVVVAVPALDRRTLAHLEYRIAGRFTRVHFSSRSESCLRSGRLSASPQLRQDLAGLGIADEVAHHFSEC